MDGGRNGDPGDRQVFSEFARLARPALLRLALFLTHQQVDAEDLVQETLLLVFLHWRHLRHAEALAYARRTMYHFFVSQRRHRRWQCETLCQPARMPVQGAPDCITPVDDAAQLGILVAQLPPRQRAVLVLRFVHDRSVADTARALGCRPSTVRSQQARALQALRTGAASLQ